MANELSQSRSSLRSLSAGARTRERAAQRLEPDGLPEITFDLSFLDQREAVHVKQTEVGDLQVRYDRQREERDLQEGFRERAAELARRSTERQEATPRRFERFKAHQPGKR